MRNPFSKPEAVGRHLKIAVTGKPGTGKTVFGVAARKYGMGRVAIISNEAGDVHYIQHPEWGDFDRLPTQRIEQLEEAISYIEANPGEYGTLVIDTVTGVYEALVSAKAKEDGSVNVKSWGLIKRKWRSLMARINNLPLNVVEVVHENDITETDDKTGKMAVVGQKLDAEKTFERNPDTLIRLGVVDGKRVCRVLKDRTGIFQAGEVVQDPNIGLWAKAVRAAGKEAHVAPPEEVDAANEAAISKPAAPEPTPKDASAVAASLIADCVKGFKDWDEKRAWSKAHKAEKDALPAALQEAVTTAFKNAAPVNKPTTTQATQAA